MCEVCEVHSKRQSGVDPAQEDRTAGETGSKTTGTGAEGPQSPEARGRGGPTRTRPAQPAPKPPEVGALDQRPGRRCSPTTGQPHAAPRPGGRTRPHHQEARAMSPHAHPGAGTSRMQGAHPAAPPRPHPHHYSPGQHRARTEAPSQQKLISSGGTQASTKACARMSQSHPPRETTRPPCQSPRQRRAPSPPRGGRGTRTSGQAGEEGGGGKQSRKGQGSDRRADPPQTPGPARAPQKRPAAATPKAPGERTGPADPGLEGRDTGDTHPQAEGPEPRRPRRARERPQEQ
ncbi:proline-rich protein 2-like [Amphiprion ocellaris]|uniref:proline-rich protein 2-like n=1 Tax=Amphiprion ocellaris TaxID=80972 RepID=UPI002411942A|nr:proline-rich protein 2-like [Amphiprion ocellaris]XP_054864437.1 proline-rich protein 2-like [Amphiprion ocellaris]XP_054864438.1 proline-rich protein 2-like [Amphiprion ocellaris]